MCPGVNEALDLPLSSFCLHFCVKFLIRCLLIPSHDLSVTYSLSNASIFLLETYVSTVTYVSPASRLLVNYLSSILIVSSVFRLIDLLFQNFFSTIKLARAFAIANRNFFLSYNQSHMSQKKVGLTTLKTSENAESFNTK